MYHTEMNAGDTLEIGNGLTVAVCRKHADGSAELKLTAKPGATFSFTLGNEKAEVFVSEKEGSRTKLSVQADRSVPIRKNT